MGNSHTNDMIDVEISRIIMIDGRIIDASREGDCSFQLQMPHRYWAIKTCDGKEVSRHQVRNIASIYWRLK